MAGYLDRIGEDKLRRCFEAQSLEPLKQPDFTDLFVGIESKVTKRWRNSFPLADDVAQRTIEAVNEALKTYKKPSDISHTQAIASLFKSYLPREFSGVLDENGLRDQKDLLGVQIAELAEADGGTSGPAKVLQVVRVRRWSDAAEAGVRKGARLQTVDGVPVESVDQVKRLLRESGRQGLRKLVFIQGDRRLEVTVRTFTEIESTATEPVNPQELTDPTEANVAKLEAEKAFDAITNQKAKRVVREKVMEGKSFREIVESDKAAFITIGYVKVLQGRGLKEYFKNLKRQAESKLNALGNDCKDLVRIYRSIKTEAEECLTKLRNY